MSKLNYGFHLVFVGAIGSVVGYSVAETFIKHGFKAGMVQVAIVAFVGYAFTSHKR
jgi:hypothetical protein